MNTQEICNYLSRLLGRPIVAEELVSLSSGRRARFAGWLTERGVPLERFRHSLGFPFKPSTLLMDGVASPHVTENPSPPLPTNADRSDEPKTLRIGIDIQRIDELFDGQLGADPKASAELTAIFTLREISYSQSRPEPLETLAGLFAAKEALRKSDAALLPRSLPELEVLPDVAGRPAFPGFSLSISHSGGFAIAVAAALGETLRRPPFVITPDTPSSVAPVSVVGLRERTNWTKTAIVTAAVLVVMLIVGRSMLHTLNIGQ